MNVVLFGINDIAVRKIALKLSECMGKVHINAHDKLEQYLLSSINLEKTEREFLKEISKKDAIISVDHDVFISNKNYKIFKKSLKIHVNFNKNNEILNNLNNLLKINSNLSISDKLNIKQIEMLIKENIK